MAEQESKRGYPYLGASAWAELRRRLKSSVPRVLDKEYLHTALGVSDKAAANLIPQLKTIGLIDDENKPADLINDFRDDEHYQRACQLIVKRVYPEALLSAVDNPVVQSDAAIRWFMRQGAGESTAKAQAKFFILLHDPKPPEPPETPKKAAKKAASAPGFKKSTPTTEQGAPPDEKLSDNGSEAKANQRPISERELPAQHIDVQIHIAADTSFEQIDKIFESMAKHLYG